MPRPSGPARPFRRPVARFAPDVRLTGIAAGGVLVALGLAIPADPPGRLLFLIAATVLLAYVAADLLYRPRLMVSADGVRVRSPFGSADLRWPEIDSVRADQRQRLGLNSVTLEIDAGAHLIVLSRRVLNADPAEVAELIHSFDPRRRPRS